MRAERPDAHRASHLTVARVAGAAAVLVFVLYALFVGTAAGREVDAFVVRHHLGGWADRLAERLTRVINPLTVPLAVLAIVGVAHRHGRLADGVRAGLLIPASAGLAKALEAALGGPDLLGGESER